MPLHFFLLFSWGHFSILLTFESLKIVSSFIVVVTKLQNYHFPLNYVFIKAEVNNVN
ncbi:hypothetical protein Lalb_Chr20g0116221 [Lupinus albus]|uniref:Uncharacterized protein n=1 Tax=Lupinus albus TaxID=3870 RepID=A0A6A4NGL3_LUPAL|nr:hypothetical protein Lalb_Chr20g0116221 [Lupinus albus]